MEEFVRYIHYCSDRLLDEGLVDVGDERGWIVGVGSSCEILHSSFYPFGLWFGVSDSDLCGC